MARMPPLLKITLRGITDHLWPPVCIACDTPSLDAGVLCADCWSALRFLGAPQCHACGVPFPYDAGDGALCAACVRARPPYDRARAAFVYDAASRSMILAFKHADRTDLAPGIVRWMSRPAAPLLADADIIAPVPLHWSRLLRRRYNQAALLAHGLTRGSSIDIIPDLLCRIRRTGTQGGKSGPARRRNVAGAFRIAERYRTRLRDKRVLLVDDVFTTGATAEAASRALLRAGAGAVDVITAARVLMSGL